MQKSTRVAVGKDVVFRVETFLVQPHSGARPSTTFTPPASLGLVNRELKRTIRTGASRQLQLDHASELLALGFNVHPGVNVRMAAEVPDHRGAL